MSAAESIRERVVSELFAIGTVKKCWPKWRREIRIIAGPKPSAGRLINELGSNLRNVFKTTARKGRKQGALAGGGHGWESLVCWYLNLCLIGTRTVVIKKASHVPAPLRHAMTLTYGSSQTNTESDLVAVTFPDEAVFNSFAGIYAADKQVELETLLETRLGQVEVCVIQCKTNWNDNAQIPMLWDLVYSSRGIRTGVSIGSHGHSVHALKSFAYAFVTLPSQVPEEFEKGSMPVLRVEKLTGGNYWGAKRKKGVAGALSDIFAKNFEGATTSLGQPWFNHLNAKAAMLSSAFKYFRY